MTGDNNAGGQRLRWWQESPPQAVPIASVIAPSASIVEKAIAFVPDIGEELEQEARCRALEGDRLVFHASESQIRRRVRQPVGRFYALLALVTGSLLSILHEPRLIGCWLILVGYLAALYAFVNSSYYFSKGAYSKLTRSILTASWRGVEIHDPGCDIGLIYWREIAEIRAYTRNGRRVIGIVPHDADALGRRLPLARIAMERGHLRFVRPLRYLNRPHTGFTAPINVFEIGLPTTAEKVVEDIEAFRRRENV